jgi:hypothetical protein
MFSCVHDEMLDPWCSFHHRLSPHPLLGLFQRLAWGSCWVGVALSPQAWNMRTMVVNRVP